ncbi:MAG: MBL fold metallo-hydrolase [Deltaproteobacteria bacterium]
MIINELGHIQSDLYILGHIECPIYLLDGPQPVVIDAGLSCLGGLYLQSIQSVLGGRQPAALFLSHVHWDHCGSVSYLKKAFPNMKIAASKTAADILKRPNAVALIKSLNENFAASMRALPGIDSSIFIDDHFVPFEIDMELHDHGSFDMSGGRRIESLATPGHTQDHFSFWLPDEKILLAGEAAGVHYGPGIVSTEFASDYEAYLSSLKRLADLPTEVFCQGHYGYLDDHEEVRAFFDLSIASTTGFKARVAELLAEESGSIDRVALRVKQERYDTIPDPKQPEPAYLLNLRAQIKHLAAKVQ